jgi:hypothetical protein
MGDKHLKLSKLYQHCTIIWIYEEPKPTKGFGSLEKVTNQRITAPSYFKNLKELAMN